MSTYKVVWSFQIIAKDEVEAAKEALKMQREQETKITSFEVTDIDTDSIVCIDLLE